MNRRIAAFAIAAVAVLGLTACSGSTSGGGSESGGGDSAPAEEASTDQSVEDACGIVLPQLTEASSAASDIDTSGGSDPQATVDQFNEVVDAFGAAADSVSNEEVKTATAAVHEDFVALGDLLSKVLIDQDMSAASDISTITTDVTESATALQELCS